MKYHNLGGLNNLHLLLTYLESGKSKTKAATDPVSNVSSLLVLPVTVFLVYLYMGAVGRKGGGRGKKRRREYNTYIFFSSSVSSYKDANLILMT